MTCDQHELKRAQHLVFRQRIAVFRGHDQGGDQVVVAYGSGTASLDFGDEQLGHLRQGFLGPPLCGHIGVRDANAFLEGVGPFPEPRQVFLRQSEELEDHAARQLPGDLLVELDLGMPLELVHQDRDALLHEWPLRLDNLPAERLDQQLAQPGVLRRVHFDRPVRDESPEQRQLRLFPRGQPAEDDRLHAPQRQRETPLQRVVEVGMACDHPAVRRLAPVDRVELAQSVELAEQRVAQPAHLGDVDIEILRPWFLHGRSVSARPPAH